MFSKIYRTKWFSVLILKDTVLTTYNIVLGNLKTLYIIAIGYVELASEQAKNLQKKLSLMSMSFSSKKECLISGE